MSSSRCMRRALAGALVTAVVTGGSGCRNDAAPVPGETPPDAGGAGGSGGGELSPPHAPAYTITAFDKVRITSDEDQPNFQQANAELDLRDGPFASVRLVVDLESTCYPFER